MICFDTQTLIWGVQGVAASGQAELVIRARKYIAYLQKLNHRILITAPAVAEYLVGFEPGEQLKQLRVLEKHFIVAAFDIPAAAQAAQILGRKADIQALAKGDYKGRRQKLRIDAFVVAAAIVHGGRTLISHDAGMVKLAAGTLLTVEELPDGKEQGDLFDPSAYS